MHDEPDTATVGDQSAADPRAETNLSLTFSDGEVCHKCGTDHDRYPPDSLSAHIQCLRARAVATSSPGLVARIDRVRSDIDRRRDDAIAAYFDS